MLLFFCVLVTYLVFDKIDVYTRDFFYLYSSSLQGPGPNSISNPLRSKVLAITRLTIHIALPLTHQAAVQVLVALVAGEAGLVPGRTISLHGFSKVNCLVTFRANISSAKLRFGLSACGSSSYSNINRVQSCIGIQGTPKTFQQCEMFNNVTHLGIILKAWQQLGSSYPESRYALVW